MQLAVNNLRICGNKMTYDTPSMINRTVGTMFMETLPFPANELAGYRRVVPTGRNPGTWNLELWNLELWNLEPSNQEPLSRLRRANGQIYQ